MIYFFSPTVGGRSGQVAKVYPTQRAKTSDILPAFCCDKKSDVCHLDRRAVCPVHPRARSTIIARIPDYPVLRYIQYSRKQRFLV